MTQKSNPACPVRQRASKDALDAISGKWKVPIIISLTYGVKRFGEIQRDVDHISPKMLAKELKDLEVGKLIKRTVHDSTPVTVEYALTPLGQSLQPLLDVLLEWGTAYRQKMLAV
jgi:DNA-binding HxlR family transcriptional regulator